MRSQANQQVNVHQVGSAGDVPFCAQTNDVAPLFTAQGYRSENDTIEMVNLVDYRGKWTVLLFYSSDFTFV